MGIPTDLRQASKVTTTPIMPMTISTISRRMVLLMMS